MSPPHLRGDTPRVRRLLHPLDRLALALSLVAAVAVRLSFLGRDDLWSDEIQTLHTMTLPLGDVLRERLAAGHVPLYFFLLRAWTELAGVSQTALRFPSALLGVAAIVPAFSLLRRILPPSPARWALAVLAVHPVLVELSREARMYPLLVLVFLIAADGAVHALDEGRIPRRLWAALLVGPFVHPSWAFAAAPLALWLAFEARRLPESESDAARAARRAAWGCVASIALLIVLLLAATPQHQELTRRPWPREIAVFALRPLIGSDLRPALYGILGLTLVGWAVCLLRGVFETAPRAHRFAFAMAVGVPIASVSSGVIGGVPWGPVRYVQCASIGLAVLAGLAALHTQRVQESLDADATSAGLGRVFERLRRDPIGAPWLVAALVVLSASRIAEPRTAWSQAAADVARRLPPTEPVWVEDDACRIVLSHYLDRDVSVGHPADGAPHWRVVVDPRAPSDATPWQIIRSAR